jgi:hypothetical protein
LSGDFERQRLTDVKSAVVRALHEVADAPDAEVVIDDPIIFFMPQ